jgi:Uma2 family endonuclease
MLALKNLPLLTPEQYLQRERAAQERSEYHQGLILAMAGGSNSHSRLIGNTFRQLDSQLNRSNCFLSMGDIKVAAANRSSFFYPDLLLRCNQQIPNHKDITTTPNLIVEVLSSSTRAYDLTTKREVYQSIPTLHTLLYIDSTKRQLHLYERDSKRKWPTTPSRPTKTLTLKHLNLAIPIDALYENIDF